MAARRGLLQRLDPRLKVLSFASFILLASLVDSLYVLAGLYALALGLAVAGRIPLGRFIIRVWVFMPFFTGLIALPAVFNIVTPGRPVLVLVEGLRVSFGPLTMPAMVAITEQGLRTAAFLVMRVVDSVSFALLLVLTTPWARLMKALRVLRVPQAFVLILSMTHRYIFLMLHMANAMFEARESRRVGRLRGPDNRRWLVGTMGALLGKSYHLSNEVYLAMVARGFRGEPKVAATFRFGTLDYGWAVFSILLFGAVLAVGLRG
jgi:cobalt/nickel transport system permease protein